MESLIFLHDAIAHEDPQPDLRFESWNLPFQLGALRGGLSLAVLLAVLNLVIGSSAIAQSPLQIGDQGSTVASLQRELRIQADGIFGPQTRDYLIAYQRLSGLPATGVADAPTLAALGLRPESVDATPVPAAIAPPSPPAANPPTSSPPTASPSTPTDPGQGAAHSATVSAATGLNVRDQPSGSVVSWLPHNQVVQLTGDRRSAGQHDWVQLADGGWVAEKYLKLDNGTPGGGQVLDKTPPQNSAGTIAPKSSGTTGQVSAQAGLIVRSAPGGSVIGSLANGQRVQVKGERQLANGRYWVQLADGGWVAADYVAMN